MKPLCAGALAGAALALAACNGHLHHDGDDDGGMSSKTVTDVVKDEIASNTSETATPIVINDLPFTGTDTNETDVPAPI